MTMTSLRPLARWSCKQQSSSIILQYSPKLMNNKSIIITRRKNVLLEMKMDFSSRSRRPSSLSSSCSTTFPEDQDDDIIINSQQLDRWVRDSAIQIVNNLDEAPFLVHINCCNKDPNTFAIKMVNDNKLIQGGWEKDPTPDAVLLVKQVVLPAAPEYNCSSSSSSSTKLWGILVQGKGKSCTACYLLKTSRVGLCTHFCLSTRLHCFVEHAHIQLQNLWLAH